MTDWRLEARRLAWNTLGSQKPQFFEALGESWGALRGVLGCLGGGFGRPGAVLKASWPHLGGAWPLFEGLLGPVGAT